MTPDAFDQLLAEVANKLAEELTDAGLLLNNIVIRSSSEVVETLQGRAYAAVHTRAPSLPDVVTVYQAVVEVDAAREGKEIRDYLERLLRHELAHHFSYSHEAMYRIQANRKEMSQ